MGRPRTHPLSLMSSEQIVEHVRGLYREQGPALLTFAGLKKAGIYFHLYAKGIKQGELIDALHARDAYEAYKVANFTYETATGIKRRWSWERVLTEARAVKDRLGHLPPGQWFQQNGMGSLVFAVYDCGKTWETLREALDCFATSNFVQSRNGLRWKSHPEASLSNFLHARGIQHKVGLRYAESISQVSDLARAYYDLHFVDNQRRWIDVEIWGDKPNGHGEEDYARKRSIKEAFHSQSSTFLGISHKECFEEDKLSAILRPYIGTIEPFVFDKKTDALLYSTHWSNADELIEFCRQLAEQQPDKVFPSESWLRKRGKEAKRDGPTYNTLSIYIKKWIGGVRKLRSILGQSEHSTIVWDRETAIAHYKAFFEQHSITPSQAKSRNRRPTMPAADLLYAQSICHAVETYAGGVKALNAALGIQTDRKWKWSRQRILDGFKAIYDRYGLVPGQIVGASQEYRIAFSVTDADLATAKSLVGIAPEHFGKVSEVYRALGIEPTDIRTAAKRREIARASSAALSISDNAPFPHANSLS